MGSADANRGSVVLIVDDDEDSRGVLRDILERERYYVLEASNGRDALDILESDVFPAIGLLVLDLLMPCMSGWELLDVIRREPALSGISIVITSGIPVQGDASGIGATLHCLRKPFDRNEFLAAVRDARGSRPSSAQHRAMPGP